MQVRKALHWDFSMHGYQPCGCTRMWWQRHVSECSVRDARLLCLWRDTGMVPPPCKSLGVCDVRHVDAGTEGTEVKPQEARKWGFCRCEQLSIVWMHKSVIPEA
jgi:hypothetical protein